MPPICQKWQFLLLIIVWYTILIFPQNFLFTEPWLTLSKDQSGNMGKSFQNVPSPLMRVTQVGQHFWEGLSSQNYPAACTILRVCACLWHGNLMVRKIKFMVRLVRSFLSGEIPDSSRWVRARSCRKCYVHLALTVQEKSMRNFRREKST